VILHLVTDRRRLTPAADEEARARCVIEQAGFALSAGIDVIQVREHDLDTRRLASVTAAIVLLTRGSRTRVVVNDRLDVALAARADGVHLRSTSFDAVHVRACTRPGFLIGRSVRTPNQAAEAGPPAERARSAGPALRSPLGNSWDPWSGATRDQGAKQGPLTGTYRSC